MTTEFHATESIALHVPPEPVGISDYLQQPQRLIKLLADRTNTGLEALNLSTNLSQQGYFRYKLLVQPLQFFHLKIRPIADIEIHVKPDSSLHLRSIGAEIKGADFMNHNFKLSLQGQLKPIGDSKHHTKLVGNVNLRVSVDIPPSFLLFTPPGAIGIVGNSLLRSVLLTMKEQLERHLIEDYKEWARGLAKGLAKSSRTKEELKSLSQITNPQSKD
ncbi:DUF1997 domain-containing protein [Tumidithrix elongata RA019]|uniref:DUF1997 domain-containing protein n=1 Tax=Tumidithrix elongata BACA0141 TaxID=2716417 RepID=A0AAW9PX67_9CYAN|nr:DUF1997 domain-containing protein [Tumidithrix elongata RA019]